MTFNPAWNNPGGAKIVLMEQASVQGTLQSPDSSLELTLNVGGPQAGSRTWDSSLWNLTDIIDAYAIFDVYINSGALGGSPNDHISLSVGAFGVGPIGTFCGALIRNAALTAVGPSANQSAKILCHGRRTIGSQQGGYYSYQMSGFDNINGEVVASADYGFPQPNSGSSMQLPGTIKAVAYPGGNINTAVLKITLNSLIITRTIAS